MRDDIIYGISVKTTNSTKQERIMLCLLLAELEKEKYLGEGETEKISKSKMTNIDIRLNMLKIIPGNGMYDKPKQKSWEKHLKKLLDPRNPRNFADSDGVIHDHSGDNYDYGSGNGYFSSNPSGNNNYTPYHRQLIPHYSSHTMADGTTLQYEYNDIWMG